MISEQERQKRLKRINRDTLTYSNSCEIHSGVLETLKDIIIEESLPINLEEGESYIDPSGGSTLVSTLITTDKPDQPEEIINYALSKAINLTFNLSE